jgi:hypothetical protein
MDLISPPIFLCNVKDWEGCARDPANSHHGGIPLLDVICISKHDPDGLCSHHQPLQCTEPDKADPICSYLQSKPCGGILVNLTV